MVEEILGFLYPFIALYAWYSVYKHNQMVSRKLDSAEHKVNGVLHELIAAREEIAFEKGKREGIVLGLEAKESQ